MADQETSRAANSFKQSHINSPGPDV